MQGLEWDEYEFVECLGVVPQFDEERVSYIYRIEKDGLFLRVEVYAYRSEIQITLSQNKANLPLLRINFFVYGSARRVKEKWGDYLKFTMCFAGNSYDWSTWLTADAYNSRSRQGAMAFLSVTPSIRFQFGDEFHY